MRTRSLLCLLAVAAPAAADEIVIEPGAHARHNCPIAVALPADSPWSKDAADGAALAVIDGEAKIPAAVLPAKGDFEILCVLPDVPAGQPRRLKLAREKTGAPDEVAFQRDGVKIGVSLGGKAFTSYDPAVAPMKQIWPVLHPIVGPGGVHLTRDYPLDGPAGESNDHPHHQGVWTAHGDVNGLNFWHLKEGHGLVKQREVAAVAVPAAGRIRAILDWCDASGRKVLEEERTITFWATPSAARIVDFDATFRATEGDVKFGDTKEGGLLSIRLADSMREKQKGDAPPGKITTSAGAAGEKEAWGKPADWCDYSGPLGGATAGAAIMAHPDNSLRPMRWHVRAYGLLTANPFGLAEFIGKGNDGSQVLKGGASWRMRFRMLVHAGGSDDAAVAAAWRDYAQPPRAALTQR